ncbi:MAG: PAS domain S-box protein [Promethearchaeota archaeon]
MAEINNLIKYSPEKLVYLIKYITDVIVEADLDGYFTYISPQVYDMFGYYPEELLGRKFFSYIHPEDMEILMSNFKKALEEKEIISIEYRVKHKKGHYIPVSAKGSLVSKEHTAKLIGVLRDISQHKIIEEELKESEEKFRTLFESSPSAIILLNLKGKIIDCNLATEVLFGYGKEELRGKNFLNLDIYSDDTIQRANEEFNLLIKGEQIDHLEIKLKKKDGNLTWIMARASLIKIKRQALIQVIANDITERKNIEQELRKINQLKTELLERTSHELKTPLISIKGFTDLLLELYRDKFDDNIISILEEIKNGTERLQSLINNLLVSSYLESGKIDFKPIYDDLAFLIRFCVKDVHPLAKTRNLFIHLDIPEKLILKFEKEKIYDVLSSLLINAIKYTPPYGEIKIKSEIKDDFVIVSVEDNGIGFTEDEKLKLFKQFGKIERYGQGWDIGVEGTGMGLYIAKKIVELHSGEIWVDSHGRNKGAKFCFSLPLTME